VEEEAETLEASRPELVLAHSAPAGATEKQQQV